MKVGFIGLGVMGRPMALHLQRVGNEILCLGKTAGVAGRPVGDGLRNAGSLGGALMLGALLGLIWRSCSGLLLAVASTPVASEVCALRRAMIFGAFGAGAATPREVAAYASRAGFAAAGSWVLSHAKTMKSAFGLLLVLLGIACLLGRDKRLEALILRLLPDAWVNLTVGI